MPTLSTFSPTSATVDLTALAHNVSEFRRRLSPGCNIMAIVKANAYGHGAVDVARALLKQGIARVAVVSVDEGIALRSAGINAPIVLLGPLFPEHIEDVLAHQLTPVISDRTVIEPLAKAAARLASPYPIHVKVETGMGRLGLSADEALQVLTTHRLPASLQLEGLMTHLADADGETRDQTDRQLRQFHRVLDGLTAHGIRVPLVHAANSGAAVRCPDAQFSLVRPGIMLYGYHTLPASVPAPDLKPVLSLRTHVAQIRTVPVGGSVSYNATFIAKRPTRVGILPIGYADGFNRRLSNRGEVLVQGRRARVIGLVCMDMVMIDVTDIPSAAVGDDAVIIGRQGTDEITANEVAAWLGTISYEVLCSIGPRVPRIYQGA